MRKLDPCLLVLTLGIAAACGDDESDGGGSGGTPSGGSAGAAGKGGTAGASASGGSAGVSDAGTEYIDDAGSCRTDFAKAKLVSGCPETLNDPSELCSLSLCSSWHQGTCASVVEYGNFCTPSRTCWYDSATHELVGAQFCDDVAVHCGNSSMCVAGGATPTCAGDANPCQTDAGSD